MISIDNFIKDNAEHSLLDNKESTAVKGLLIILVLLGHNKYLMTGGLAFIFLYSFHIYSFFFLPFFYNYKHHELGRYVVKSIRKYYLPYLVGVSAVAIISLLRGESLDIREVMTSILSGNPYGALSMGSFLWFLPTMLVLVLCKEIYYLSSFWGRAFIILVSLICYLNYGFGGFGVICDYLPFMIRNGIAMIFPGLLCRSLYLQVSDKQIFGLLFLCVVLFDFIFLPYHEFYSYKILTRYIGTIIICLFVVSQGELLKKSKLLLSIGSLSFEIYLVHIFVYNCLYYLIDSYCVQSIFVGIPLFVVVLSLSFFLSYLFRRYIKL